MSAFIVSTRTINRIVYFLGAHWDFPWASEILKGRLQLNITTLEGQQDLATKMYALNHIALEERYGKCELVGGIHYKPEPDTTDFVAYKALSCFLFQCEEGAVPETDLYKVLTDIQHGLAEHIIQGLPEWDSAAGWE